LRARDDRSSHKHMQIHYTTVRVIMSLSRLYVSASVLVSTLRFSVRRHVPVRWSAISDSRLGRYMGRSETTNPAESPLASLSAAAGQFHERRVLLHCPAAF